MLSAYIFLLVSSYCLLVSAYKESFEESLHLRPLPDGKLHARFAFTTTLFGAAPRSADTIDGDDTVQHYTLFPLPLVQLLRAQAITEMHLTMNSGKWDYDDWGYPEDFGVASGAELWVWMDAGRTVNTDERWRGLSNGLAGLFCASLGSLDRRRVTRPAFAFQPEGDLTGDDNELIHAFLPSESVCTENLTPFLKLLPCKGRSGLASLLNPHNLFDSTWHGIGINVIWKGDLGIEVKLTFNAILDPVRTSSSGKRDWDFPSLFGREITRHCPVAESSTITVDLPLDTSYSIAPEPSEVIEGKALYKSPTNIGMIYPLEQSFHHSIIEPKIPLSVRRVLTGASQSQGGLLLNFVNRQNISQEVVCVEVAPWFINYFLNTRRVTVNGVERPDVILETSYTLPYQQKPTLLESVIRLPPQSEVAVTMDFAKGFIKYTDHPPDAERGWDLPAAVITFRNEERRLYTRNLLINLPTPDFSMPYNVIIMTSTVVALLFGTIFNMLVRKFVWVRIAESPSTVEKLRE